MPVMPPRKKKVVEPAVEPALEPAIQPRAKAIRANPSAVPEKTATLPRDNSYFAFLVLVFAAGVLFGYLLWGVDSPAAVAQTANQPVTEQDPYKRHNIPIENAYALGPVDAPITIVEFSDYQCPYCRRWHEEVYEPLLATYPGQIRFVYRHLPLASIHSDATSAAEAAMCAGEQDAFWLFHEKLFSGGPLGNRAYLQYAQELALNMNNFESCINNRKYQEVVEQDLNFAIDLGLRSTPTFFVNGIMVIGAQPLDVFKNVIDKELAGEIPG